jgi:hypothetical protein
MSAVELLVNLVLNDERFRNDVARVLHKELRAELKRTTAAAKQELHQAASNDVRLRNTLRHRVNALEAELAAAPAAAWHTGGDEWTDDDDAGTSRAPLARNSDSACIVSKREREREREREIVIFCLRSFVARASLCASDERTQRFFVFVCFATVAFDSSGFFLQCRRRAAERRTRRRRRRSDARATTRSRARPSRARSICRARRRRSPNDGAALPKKKCGTHRYAHHVVVS